uniref:Uncharacterized protein n=1 Tax=Picea glauca TaxID=3330 RepID=A0A101M3G6_PICGL|nr:hypothetical protein ABT39_MTgene107 [Picea glauca]
MTLFTLVFLPVSRIILYRKHEPVRAPSGLEILYLPRNSLDRSAILSTKCREANRLSTATIH